MWEGGRIDDLKVVADNLPEIKCAELTMNIDLQEIFTEMNNEPKLQEPGDVSYILLMVSNEKLLPFVLKTTSSYMESLMSHLDHLFFGEKRMLPQILSSTFSHEFWRYHRHRKKWSIEVGSTTLNQGAAWEATQGEFFFSLSLHLFIYLVISIIVLESA